HILDHELAHVLQQTGPRPIASQDLPVAPQRGKTSGGLRYDQGVESSAERTAKAVRQRARPDPIAIQRQEEEGPTPLFDKFFMAQVVRLFGSYGDVVEFQRQIDTAPTGKARKDPPGTDKARKLWEEIKKKLAGVDSYADSFKSVKTQILDHMMAHDTAVQRA